MADQLLKFLFDEAPVRGQMVRLGPAWQQIVAHHDYPQAVARLLGETTAAAVLLCANLKFDGTLLVQIQGDGPVRLLVVECDSDLTVRAMAKFDRDAPIAPDAALATLVNRHGHGRCAITLDTRNRAPGQQPYQGIVALSGDSMAAALEAYMRQSEQLETRLWLAADGAHAAGVLLQKLPDAAGAARPALDADAWERANALASTVTRAELLATEPAALRHRLFWQETLQVYAPLVPRFRCVCSRERIGRMLVSIGRAECDGVLAELGRVEVRCEFCNALERFDAVDVAQLFATGGSLTTAAPGAH